MFTKFRKLFGAGKADTAALVREIIRGHEPVSVLFEAENKQALEAFVNYGHKFLPAYFPCFLQVADKALVKTYLEMGFGLEDKEVKAVLDLKDDELNQVMIDQGSWCPFPYGNCLHHSARRRQELDEQHELVAGLGASVSL